METLWLKCTVTVKSWPCCCVEIYSLAAANSRSVKLRGICRVETGIGAGGEDTKPAE